MSYRAIKVRAGKVSMFRGFYSGLALGALWISVAAAWAALSQAAPASTPTALAPTANFGPYNVTFLEGSVGLARPLSEEAAPIASGAPWSITGWLRSARRQPGEVIVAAIGNVAGGEWRGLALVDGALTLVVGPAAAIRSSAVPDADRWYAVAAVFDGRAAHLYLDGRELDVQPASTVRVRPTLELAPAAAGAGVRPHFGGSLAQWTLLPAALGAAAVESLARAPPDFSLVTFDPIGVGWPWQEHAWRGLQEPQEPWTLPQAKSPPSKPLAEPITAANGLASRGLGAWALGSWRLRSAPGLDAGGAQLSQPDYDDSRWYPAVVPGTVLTTLIARGVYPDPNYGLDNLAIPDSLSRQDYWYRSVFAAPGSFRDRDLSLVFKGINYAAEVWLNGRRLGSIRGAFTRGRFDVTGILRAGESNAIAVRVSPPPHPGI